MSEETGGEQTPVLATEPTATEVSWNSGIDSEFRDDPSMADIKDLNGLAKSFVHAQRLVGQDKVLKPQASWNDQQRSDFFNSIGRPETADKYQLPSMEGLEVQEGTLKKTLELYHSAGLTQQQVNTLMSNAVETAKAQDAAAVTAATTARNGAETALREQWGTDYEPNVELARNVIARFASESLKERFRNSEGNDPEMIALFHSLGTSLLEDQAVGATGGGLSPGSSANAKAEIGRLKADPEFKAAWLDDRNPGHKDAVERMTSLNSQAYGHEPVTA